MSEELRFTAYHEAGHAVVAYLLHVPFRYVTIVPDDESGSLGHIMWVHLAKTFRPDVDADLRTRARVEHYTMACFAGRIAEIKSGSEAAKTAEYTDDSQAVDWASYMAAPFPEGEDMTELDYYIAWLHARTRNMLDLPENWRAVEALAAALLEHNRLSRAAAVRVIDEAIQAD